MLLRRLTHITLLAFILLLISEKSAHALRYDLCKTPKQSLSCAVAFEKLRTLDNPITGKKYFENGVHIQGNKLLKMPGYHIAQPDLDSDGVKEIIVSLSGHTEEGRKYFCKSARLCAHYIIQNRNPDPNTPRLRNFKVIGNAYAIAISTSKDEVINKYRSLVIYKSPDASKFNVYQYDREEDEYYNLGEHRKRGTND